MWLLVPYTESDSAAELSASSLDLKLLCPSIEHCAVWNGKRRSLAEWRRAFKKDRSLHYLSGLTLPPSAATHGAEEFISLAPVSRASRFRLPGSGKEPPTTAGSGLISPESLEKSDRNSAFSKTSPACSEIPIATLTPSGTWETPQQMLSGDFQPYSGTWPASGSMRTGSVYERPTWEPATAENGFSFWPTATASEGSNLNSNQVNGPTSLREAADQWRTPDAPSSSSGPRNRQGSIGHGHQTTIGEQAEHWATPDAGVRRGFNKSPSPGASLRPLISKQTEQWATPNVPNGGRVLSPEEVLSRGATDRGKRQVGLEMETQYWEPDQWATPAERDYRAPNSLPDAERGRGKKGPQLGNQASFWKTPFGQGNVDKSGKPGGAGDGEFSKQATNWATPRAEDSESCGNHPGAQDSLTGQTFLWAPSGSDSSPAEIAAEPTPPGCALPSHKRKLNPFFETWLMGWNLFWLTSVPRPSGRSAMASYLSRQRSALSSLLAARGL